MVVRESPQRNKNFQSQYLASYQVKMYDVRLAVMIGLKPFITAKIEKLGTETDEAFLISKKGYLNIY